MALPVLPDDVPQQATEHELARMRALYSTAIPGESRREIHHAHIRALVAKLRPRVQQALLDETKHMRQEAMWPTQARRLQMGLWGGVAPKRRVASLARALNTAAKFDPDQAEVTNHTHELAQLLLSNWFGVLRRWAETETLEPMTDLLPTADMARLMDGVGRFAPSHDEVLMVLREYRDDMVRTTGQAHLAPDMVLSRRTEGEWVVHITNEEAGVS